VSPKRVALGSLFLVPNSVNPIAVARYSPKESHLKWFSLTNYSTCLGADPPAPVSKSTPPAKRGTMESILAEVPNSMMGNRSVR
jgi:hypothetical protein